MLTLYLSTLVVAAINDWKREREIENGTKKCKSIICYYYL